MSIDLMKIAEKLHAGVILNAPDSSLIRYATLIDGDHVPNRPDTVYIGVSSHYPEIFSQIGPVNFVCTDSEDAFRGYLENSCFNVLFLPGMPPLEILDVISAMIYDEEYIINCSLRLYEELSSDRGIQKIIDTASELLHNPILVSDTSFKLLAHSSNKDVNDELWLKIINNGYHPKDFIHEIIKENLSEVIFGSNKPVIIKDAYSHHRYISKKINIGGRAIAVATVIEYYQEFQEHNSRILEALCKIIACEFSKNTYLNQSRGLMYECLIEELLTNSYLKIDFIEERLEYINLKLKDSLYAFVASLMNENPNKVLLPYLRNELESIIPDGKCIIYQESLVMLISQNHKCTPFDEKSLESLLTFLDKNNLSSGISRRFSNICDLKEHYRQACEAIRIGMHLDYGKHFYEYSAYSIYDLLAVTSNHRNLHHFCEPKIFEIIAYDKKYQTNYAHTLYIYLQTNQNPVAAAHKLEIHRNTIDYRMNKISDLFNINMGDSNVTFSLRLSYHILLFLGEFSL